MILVETNQVLSIMEFESKKLFVNFAEASIPFTVTPFKREKEGDIVFVIDMGDQDAKTIHYSFNNGWWQLSGKQIYTDILHLMGGLIHRHYPELF